MADHQALASGHPDMDDAEHEKTYRMFVSMTKWGTVLMVLLLVFMAVTLL